MEDFTNKAKQHLDKVISLIQTDLGSIKTGRAKPSLIENLKVPDAYPGTTMELKELASISAPDPQQLIVKPWDAGVLSALEKALGQSDLGINPVVDGDLIRIKIPALTGERRDELVKLVWQKIESGRVLVRQVRADIKEDIEGQAGEAGVSEDDIHVWLDQLQKVVDDYTAKLEKLGEAKEAELRQI